MLAVRPVVCKFPKRNNWAGTTLIIKVDDDLQINHILPTSFTEYAAVEVTWRVMSSKIKLRISG